ncbi:MAG: hypothetical protein ACRDA5_16525 [Clostridium sp.]
MSEKDSSGIFKSSTYSPSGDRTETSGIFKTSSTGYETRSENFTKILNENTKPSSKNKN